ncbi:MAG: YceI family protein [Cytophagales bacterium]|nr:YceI family protein [Cytophagales bacterium]
MLSNIMILLFWVNPGMQNRTLVLNNERSELSFMITHMGFLTVEGNFGAFDASLTMENDYISQIEGTIQVASIYTEESTRDETLKGPVYLDAKRFPTMTFSSNSILLSTSENQINGRLRIKSEEREVVIPYQIEHLDTSLILTAEVLILRSEFNLDFGAMDQLIGDEIKVSAKLVFVD